MAKSQAGNTEEQNDLSDIKRKLAKRMGVAALMIVGLLGGLAVFDRLSTPADTDSSNAPQFSEPVPVAKKVQTQPVTPTEPVTEPVKENKVAAEPEFTAPPVDKSGVGLGLPPPPEVINQPVIAPVQVPANHVAKGVGKPGLGPEPVKAAKPAKSMPSVEMATPIEATKGPEPVRQSESPKPAAISQAPEPEKQTRAVEAAEPPVVLTPPTNAAARLFSGYALQVGVFSDPRRAEELHAKLTQEGIPAFIEARVEVGPFKSKEEADAARAKLNALGIESVMLSPKGAKR